MSDLSCQVAHYLQEFRRGGHENAFFGLLDLGHEIIPGLIAAFRAESDFHVRAFLVEIIWQYRERSVIPFLGEALRDPEQDVWKQALDGLAALASPESLEVLRSTKDRKLRPECDEDEFHVWLDEAIKQIEERIEV